MSARLIDLLAFLSDCAASIVADDLEGLRS
jgi:hypothetical protein